MHLYIKHLKIASTRLSDFCACQELFCLITQVCVCVFSAEGSWSALYWTGRTHCLTETWIELMKHVGKKEKYFGNEKVCWTIHGEGHYIVTQEWCSLRTRPVAITGLKKISDWQGELRKRNSKAVTSFNYYLNLLCITFDQMIAGVLQLHRTKPLKTFFFWLLK